jgi:hypothetical protein
MIYAQMVGGKMMAPAEVKDHTDDELVMLDKLVGRTSPIVERNQKLKGGEPGQPEAQSQSGAQPKGEAPPKTEAAPQAEPPPQPQAEPQAPPKPVAAEPPPPPSPTPPPEPPAPPKPETPPADLEWRLPPPRLN